MSDDVVEAIRRHGLVEARSFVSAFYVGTARAVRAHDADDPHRNHVSARRVRDHRRRAAGAPIGRVGLRDAAWLRAERSCARCSRGTRAPGARAPPLARDGGQRPGGACARRCRRRLDGRRPRDARSRRTRPESTRSSQTIRGYFVVYTAHVKVTSLALSARRFSPPARSSASQPRFGLVLEGGRDGGAAQTTEPPTTTTTTEPPPTEPPDPARTDRPRADRVRRDRRGSSCGRAHARTRRGRPSRRSTSTPSQLVVDEAKHRRRFRRPSARARTSRRPFVERGSRGRARSCRSTSRSRRPRPGLCRPPRRPGRSQRPRRAHRATGLRPRAIQAQEGRHLRRLGRVARSARHWRRTAARPSASGTRSRSPKVEVGQARRSNRHHARLEQAPLLRQREVRPQLRRRDRPGRLSDPARRLRDREHAAEPVVVPASLSVGDRTRSPFRPAPGTRWARAGWGCPLRTSGIHGTPDAASIGYSASHGCIRMRIPDAEWLFQHVKIGTPVFIVAK